MNNFTVIDLFCGAGGFSEGFRQQGFDIVNGYDYWKPAVETYSHNFGTGKGVLKNILDFKEDISAIEALPDTDVILGSPPCVSFSNSNRSGKADKSMGIALTEVFLKIVAVKKFQPNSKLKAWYMENVTNSTNYLAGEYNFKDLGLYDWAKTNRISPNKIAIKILGNSIVINSADYGSSQTRRRVITGEFIAKKRLIVPYKTNRAPELIDSPLPPYRTISELRNSLPLPNTPLVETNLVLDPQYKGLSIFQSMLTDHFYDTGLYECEWENSRFLKTNHPYMGNMSFPENPHKPSRTVTATKIGTSRESIIYKSEYNRIGNGEFRTPTVREAACIMGFPITYQFVGSESTKWRLIGNAVCPTVSKSFATIIRRELGCSEIETPIIKIISNIDGINNLNTFSEKDFYEPPKRAEGSRFRRHPFKQGNITVTLSNYDILKNEKKPSKWITSVQYGNGEGFPHDSFSDDFHIQIEPLLLSLSNGRKFMDIINNGFSKKIAGGKLLQIMYENQQSQEKFLEPTRLIHLVSSIINELEESNAFFNQTTYKIFRKNSVPVKQLFALYAINKIAFLANQNN